MYIPKKKIIPIRKKCVTTLNLHCKHWDKFNNILVIMKTKIIKFIAPN